MRVIKRYPNRKLYDTESKKYITLDGIASLIREGHELQVVDHESDEDLTAVVLTQIIFEQEKKSGGFLPHSVLKGLVQAGGDTLSTLRQTLANPLELFNQVDEEINRRVRNLIRAGEIGQQEGMNLLEKLVDSSSRTFDSILPSRAELNQKLNELGIPTHENIKALNDRLDALSAALAERSAELEKAKDSAEKGE